MAEPLHFNLVSPERLLISQEVESVVVPGTEGFFTVLARHAPFMSTLKPGPVDVKGLDGGTQRIFVTGGFADVSPLGLTILADRAFRAEDLDPAELAEEVRRAEEDLSDLAADHPKRVSVERKLSELRETQRWIIPA